MSIQFLYSMANWFNYVSSAEKNIWRGKVRKMKPKTPTTQNVDKVYSAARPYQPRKCCTLVTPHYPFY